MSDQILISDGDLVIRRMRDHDEDYDLMVRWRNAPHVRRWWDPDLPLRTLRTIKEEHRADTATDAVSVACIIELDRSPIGFIQFYRWCSYAEDATKVGVPFDDQTYGIDIFIGDPDLVGRGVGTRVVSLMSDYLLTERAASSVALTCDVENHRAQQCYENAGFSRVKEVLDTDTYRGERCRSWLMVNEGIRAGSPRESSPRTLRRRSQNRSR